MADINCGYAEISLKIDLRGAPPINAGELAWIKKENFW
jgi:hypothetical protein